MATKLPEETSANTLRISQSLTRRTRSETTQNKEVIHTFCNSKNQLNTNTPILFFISESTSFKYHLPCDIDFKLANIPLTPKKVEAYLNYCNSQYKTHKTTEDSWYNLEPNTFVRIFFDTNEEYYMLIIKNISYEIN